MQEQRPPTRYSNACTSSVVLNTNTSATSSFPICNEDVTTKTIRSKESSRRASSPSAYDWILLNSPPNKSPLCLTPSLVDTDSDEVTTTSVHLHHYETNDHVKYFERFYFDEASGYSSSICPGNYYSDISGWKLVSDDLPSTSNFEFSVQSGFLSHASTESCHFRLALEELKLILHRSEHRSNELNLLHSRSSNEHYLNWLIEYIFSVYKPSKGSLRWAVQEIARFPNVLGNLQEAASVPSTLLSSLSQSKLFSLFAIAPTTFPKACFNKLMKFSYEMDGMGNPVQLRTNSFFSFVSEESFEESLDSHSNSSKEFINNELPPIERSTQLQSNIVTTDAALPVLDAMQPLASGLNRMHRCLSLMDATLLYNRCLEKPTSKSYAMAFETSLEISKSSLRLGPPSNDEKLIRARSATDLS